MRKFILPLLLLSLLLGACQEQASQSDSIAVVDVQRLVSESEPGKAAQAFLEGMQKDFNDRLTAMQGKINPEKPDQAAAQALQMAYLSLQQRMQAEEQNVQNTLIEHVLRIVRAYRDKKGYKAILRSEAAIAYDKAIDVTSVLLDEVNLQKIDFKPVTKDAPEKTEAPKAEAPKAEEAANAPATKEGAKDSPKDAGSAK